MTTDSPEGRAVNEDVISASINLAKIRHPELVAIQHWPATLWVDGRPLAVVLGPDRGVSE